MLPISNEEILEQIKKQGSIYGAAKALQISWQTVKLAQSGKRKIPKARGVMDKKNLCSCCGLWPKAKGNRYLCEYCFSTAQAGEIYPKTKAWI